MRNLEKHAVRGIALSLLHDYVDVLDVRNDIETFCRRLSNEGLPFVTKKLAALGKSFDASLGTGIFTWDTKSFQKDPVSKVVPEFLRSLYLRVFDEDGHLRARPCYRAVRFIRTFCFLFYKWELDTEWDEEEIMRQFEETDDNVVTGFLLNENLQNRVKHSFNSVFSDFDPENLIGSHGPGVSSNVSRNEKFSFFPPHSAVIEKFGRRFFNHSEETHVVNMLLFVHSLLGVDPTTAYTPTAKMLLVPKDSRGPRVISCEPVEHMFAQQSIKDYMVRTLESHPKTAGLVNFTDQTVNRSLVERHSIDREYSTLDLKDASDMVPNSVIMDVLSKELGAYVKACRSEWTLSPKGDRVRKLNKFAPMGSALCFPVMASYLFFGVTAFISMELGIPESKLKPIYVYGDDMVVPTEYARLAIDAIQALGLVVNKDKSFVNSRFLESCGMDCLDGVVVSPFRIKKLNWKAKRTSGKFVTDPDSLIHLVKVSNQCQDVFPSLSEFLYQSVEAVLGKLPYGTAETPFLCRLSASSADAWAMNRLRGLIPQKIRAFSVQSLEVETSVTSYGLLRKALSKLGMKKPLQNLALSEWVFDNPVPLTNFAQRRVRLVRRTFQEWYSTAYMRAV